MNNTLEKLIQNLNQHTEIYQYLNVSVEDLVIFNRLTDILIKVKELISIPNIDSSYIQLYKNQIEYINSILPWNGNENLNSLKESLAHSKEYLINHLIESITPQLNTIVPDIEFQVDLFNKMGYYDSNIVIVGANGSGKTSLSDKLKVTLNYNGVVVSAQRVLKLPEFDSIKNQQITENKLIENQRRDKKYKNESDFSYILDDFEVVIQHLLAKNAYASNLFRQQFHQTYQEGQNSSMSPVSTELDETLKIWNTLITHRTLKCDDGISLKVFIEGKEGSYSSIQMSEGEKVLLYLIAQVLLAPEKGFIVIDEPEMYLHKTILKKLWDTLEAKRNDCLFIYLTHDLDFATSRNDAKKVWVKSYTYPHYWELESINTSDIPEAMLLEILGSRKKILFCEGEKNSIDEKIYSILFSEYTVIPVGSCFDVMNHTKAFNKLKNIDSESIGIIDSDYHSFERLNKLKEDKVYNFSVAEVENLFLDEEFLKDFVTFSGSEGNKIPLIKEDIINELEKNIDLQVSNYVSTKINNIFNDHDFSKGNSLVKIEENFQTFIRDINISDFYEERKRLLEDICHNSDYEKAILVFNNKGLRRLINFHLKITDFPERCFRFLQKEPEKIRYFKKYFPQELF